MEGKVGRPSSREIAKKKAKKNEVAKAYQQFRDSIIASPKARKVLDKILDAALDDEHKNQAAAWKIWADRALPIRQFERERGGSKIEINITGVTAKVSEVIEGEVVE